MKNILVIKLRYIGDVLLATPVLASLRAAWPQARLTMAVNRGTEAVLAENPHVDEVLVVERKGIGEELACLRDLRRRRFDCVVDLTDSDRSAIMAMATGAPTRVGFNWEHRWRGIAYTSLVDAAYGARHMVDYDLCALESLGLAPATRRPILRVGPSAEAEASAVLAETGLTGRLWVMMHPGARYWFKSWSDDRFAALIDRFAARGLPSALVGGEGERGKAERIGSQCPHAPVILAGRTSLSGLAALMKSCTLFVGNDAGPMHMAAAVGTPVVGLFGPSDPRVWGPRGERVEVLYKGVDCRPCFHPSCDRGPESCMNQIRVDDVLEAADRLLSRWEVRSGSR
jgi:predicted lipopolysaccharide heptosyltransferase III